MSLSPTPTIYFTAINYNPLFYQRPSGVSLGYVSQNFLKRLGVNPTSIATNTTFQENITIQKEAIINDGAVVENFAVSGSLVVGGKISSGSKISCDSLFTNNIISIGDISHENKIGGFLYSTVFPYSFPLTRTNLDITFTFGINLLPMLSTSSSVFLQPRYKIVFVDFANGVIGKVDNTNGRDPLYQLLPSPNGYVDYNSCVAIYMFYKGVQLSYPYYDP